MDSEHGNPTSRSRANDNAVRSSWLRSLGNYVFGFDFFISYAHADAFDYAEQLAEKLAAQGFECFLDAEDYAAGDDWKQTGRVALRRTSRLILIGSPAALRSGPVLREVNTFGAMHRRIIPIDVGNTLGAAKDSDLVRAVGEATIRIPEPLEALAVGPSKDVVDRIRDSFDLIRQHRRRQRVLTAATAVFAFLAILAAGLAWQANQARGDALEALARAERETRRVRAGELAARSDQVVERFPQRSVLLAVEAIRVTEQDGVRLLSAEAALRNRLHEFPATALLGPGHTLSRVDITPDDRWIVGRSDDGGIWLWDLSAQDPWRAGVELPGPVRGGPAMQVSSDGRLLVTGGKNGIVRIWDLHDDTPWNGHRSVEGHVDGVTAVALSADGRWLAAAADDGSCRLWDLDGNTASGRELTPALAEQSLGRMMFTADNRWLVGWNAAGKAWLWDIASADGDSGRLLLADDQETQTVILTADSRWLTILTSDNNLLWWDLAAPFVPGSPLSSWDWENSINRVALSGDERWLFTETNDGSLLLWPLTGDWPGDDAIELWQSPAIEEDPWDDEMEFTPSADGRWLVVTLGRFDWGVWDLRPSDPADVKRIASGSEVIDQSISADGRIVAVLHEGGIEIWDMEKAGPLAADSAELSLAFNIAAEPEVSRLSLSPDGRWLLAGTIDGRALFWDLYAEDGGEARRLAGHEGNLARAVFSGTSDWALVRSSAGSTRLWELQRTAQGTPPLTLMPDGWDRNISLSADSRWLYSRSYRNSYRWDLGAVSVARTRMDLPEDQMRNVVSSDGRWVVSQSGRQAPELRDLQADNPSAIVRTLATHTEGLHDASIRVYGDWLEITRPTRFSWLYDISGAEPARGRIELHEYVKSTRDAAISQNGDWLAMHFDGTAGLWNLASSDPLDTELDVTPDDAIVSAVAFTPDGAWLLIGTETGGLRLLHASRADPFASTLDFAAHSDEILRFMVSPRSRWMLAESRDGVARLWDLQQVAPESAGRVLEGGGGAVRPLPFSADERWLVTRGEAGSTRLWNLDEPDTATAMFVLSADKMIYEAWMVPGNRWLLTLDEDDRMELWDLFAEDPTKARKELLGHESDNLNISVSPDGGRLATYGGDEQAIRLWDLTTEDPSLTAVLLEGHQEKVTAARFSADSRWLVTQSDDRAVRLWPMQITHLLQLAKHTAGRNLSAAEWSLYFPGTAYQKTFPDLSDDVTPIAAGRR